jgi:hypothetical protein
VAWSDKENEEFFKNFREMQSQMLPTKKKMFAWGMFAFLVNVVLFIGAVAVIALAVKWVIS